MGSTQLEAEKEGLSAELAPRRCGTAGEASPAHG